MIWSSFALKHKLTEQQLNQFKQFYTLLTTYNQLINLTAIEDFEKIISHHFDDSLALRAAVNLHEPLSILDVGSGGGFPGIPLKIKYPHIQVFLLEVTLKKVNFLQKVIAELNLSGCEVIPLDWRTFLRKEQYQQIIKIDVVCSRASLHTDELIRMFKPLSPYKHGTLVYWASSSWQAGKVESQFLKKELWYTIDHKQRKLAIFSMQEQKDIHD